MTAIQAVVFDLGDVFVKVLHARAAEALARRRIEGPERLHRAIVSSPVLHRYETGEIDRRAFFTQVCEDTRISLEFDDFCALFCDIFEPIPEMIAVNARLRRSGLRTYLFSNTSELHFGHLTRTQDFMAAFDGYFLSCELGSMKPRAPIYEAVERGSGLSGGELLYIDDRLDNIEAGAARGWQVIHHVSPRQTIEAMQALGLSQATAARRSAG